MKPYDYSRWEETRRFDPALDLAYAGLSLWMRALDSLLAPIVYLKKRSNR